MLGALYLERARNENRF